MSKRPIIVLPDGSPLSEDNVRPKIFGYQIVHKLTGRILPSTTRKQVYSKAAAIKKMNHVASMYTVMQASLDIWDYELVPLYEHEKPEEYVYFMDNDDHLFD